jgi:hypothetical protein
LRTVQDGASDTPAATLRSVGRAGLEMSSGYSCPAGLEGAAWRWPARALSQRIDTCCAHAPTAAGTADDWPPSPSASPSSGAAPYPIATTVGIREGKNDVEVTVLLGTALTESLAKASLRALESIQSGKRMSRRSASSLRPVTPSFM